MAKTFDYARAWSERARPAYEALTQNLRDLVARVATEAGDLAQLSDCSMPWPEGSNLAQAFDKIPAEWLSQAAEAVHDYGHWFPVGPRSVGAEVLPAGASWKFSHYADQSLRARLGLPTRGDDGRSRGVSFAIHEGRIRLCYSSKDSWMWVELFLATETGLTEAKQVAGRVRSAVAAGKTSIDQDNIAYTEIEALRATYPSLADQYMIDEADLSARHAAERPAPDRKRQADKIRHEAELAIDAIKVKRDGELWLLDHGFDAENAIYYSHTGRWAFGWRKLIPDGLRSRMLDHLSEFPFDYDFVTPREYVTVAGK